MTGAGPSDALAAFLRGQQRRAGVFARWYGGDAWSAARAWKEVQAPVQRMLPDANVADWPRLFWRALLDTPALKQADRAGGVAVPGLGRQARGPRAVLLLRLVAELDDDTAAQVLGVAPSTYREVLDRHRPRRHDGQLDEQTWRVLRERVQAELRGEASRFPVPGAGEAHPHRPGADEPAWELESGEAGPPRAWRWPAMAAAGILTALAVGMTFRHGWDAEPEPEVPPGAVSEALIRVEALPPAPESAARPTLAGDTLLLTDPDFALLAAGIASEQFDQIAFNAWHAARLEDQREAERRAAELMALENALHAVPEQDNDAPEMLDEP